MAEMSQLPATPATAGKPTTHLLVPREIYMVLQDGWQPRKRHEGGAKDSGTSADTALMAT
jgi:hypothetical protein